MTKQETGILLDKMTKATTPEEATMVFADTIAAQLRALASNPPAINELAGILETQRVALGDAAAAHLKAKKAVPPPTSTPGMRKK